MSHSHATGYSSEPTNAQFKELFAQVASGRITKRRLQRLLGSARYTLANENEIVRVMGEDIIFPCELAAYLGCSYTQEDYKLLSDTVPDMKTLRWLKKNGYILFPGPEREMKLSEIDAIKLRYTLRFGGSSVVTPGWHAIRKGLIPNSTWKRVEEGSEYETETEYMPRMGELAWGIAVVRGVFGLDLVGEYHSVYVLMQDGTPYSINDHLYGECMRHTICSDKVGFILARKL